MKMLTAATVMLIAAVMKASAGFEAGSAAPVAPALLSETGLYAGEGTTQIDPRNRPFSPQYPLWSDGAAKKRWIRLPDGAAIDATDVTRWEFPVGTRFWKEFSFNGRKVETRLLWRATADRWVFASYAWNDEQTDAVLAPETGIPGAAEIAPFDVAQGKPGKLHTIPAVTDCRSCHDSARTEILGFDVLNLSDDRDPNAPHAETLAPEMITLRTLTEENLIYPTRPELIATPPRIAGSPQTRAALGYLSTNCGSCHNRESSIASLGLLLKHTDQAALATTVNQRGHWIVPEAQEESRLVNPGHPESSAIVRRVKSRRPSSQMPPLGTVIVDREAVDLLSRWVEELGDRKCRPVTASASTSTLPPSACSK
jgi:mono/diheme cytochrome c family protein